MIVIFLGPRGFFPKRLEEYWTATSSSLISFFIMPSCQPRRCYNLSPLLFQSQVQILHPKSLQPRSKDLARTKSSRSSSRHCPCGSLPWSNHLRISIFCTLHLQFQQTGHCVWSS